MQKQLQEMQDSAEKLEQFLENLVQKGKKLVSDLVWKTQSPEKQQAQAERKDLRIQKGRRVVWGQTMRGFRSDLKPEDMQALDKLLSEPPDSKSEQEKRQPIPDYEIKLGQEVLLRQEKDGTISVNRFHSLERSAEIDADKPLTYKDAFSAKHDPAPDISQQDKEAQQQEFSKDLDGDSLTGAEEAKLQTQPLAIDSDFDGNNDARDTNPTNPVKDISQQDKEAQQQEFSKDLDGDSLTGAEEAKLQTQPLAIDSDSDGNNDARDTNPTNPVNANHSSTKPLELSSVEPNPKNAPTPEPNPTAQSRILLAVILAERDASALPGKAQQLFTNLFKEIGQKITELGQTAVQWVASSHEWKQNQDVASTALKLFEQNYAQTGQTLYEAVGYNISLSGKNNFELTDKNGNKLMQFEKTRGGIKVNESNLRAIDYQEFLGAKTSLKEFQNPLARDSQVRLGILRGLAPEGDEAVVRAISTKEVMTTASNFLNYMGVDKWDRKGKGNYNIERSGEQYLRIESKADGRGTILELKHGQLTNNLSYKDFAHFRALEQLVQQRLEKVLNLSEQQKSGSTLHSQRSPKIHKQQELSL